MRFTMATPHTCPTCQGHKAVYYGAAEIASPWTPILDGSLFEKVDCPTCDATGVVWEKVAQSYSVQLLGVKEETFTG